MAFRPNYGMQRADRNRAAQARREEKMRKREEKSAQRKAERILRNNNSPDDAKEKFCLSSSPALARAQQFALVTTGTTAIANDKNSFPMRPRLLRAKISRSGHSNPAIVCA
jgi:hypothetical protein